MNKWLTCFAKAGCILLLWLIIIYTSIAFFVAVRAALSPMHYEDECTASDDQFNIQPPIEGQQI